MSAAPRNPSLSDVEFIDPTPMPDSIPKVDEIGATSAPLQSAAFFIGAYCKEYNEDFMLCKNENNDPAHCLKEGRKVTRCAIDLLRKLREHCDKEFEAHWTCLDLNNQEYHRCRAPERKFNACVMSALKLEKYIPDSPANKPQIHLKEKPLYY
ncbi:hypothetical protein Glove_49g23 [Diversispora epigaea]|uniref:NADH-ubiquinone oxidoreductase n=1 Tax=Diversispora epigaea TaxID=1348612 RepID=A0A397JEW2_9GLOM|nr:hypothetical protein Glove_49g23 [Diversispora epigaea]